MKKINVTCGGETYLDYKELIPFQGSLKRTSKEDKEKLINSIIEEGFSFPFFYWENKGKKYIFDGHHRKPALEELNKRGYNIPLLPADHIKAKDKKNAAKKLLLLNSQYGKITQDTFESFCKSYSLDINLDLLNIEIPDIILEDIDVKFKPKNNRDTFDDIAERQLNKQLITCPYCKKEFEID